MAYKPEPSKFFKENHSLARIYIAVSNFRLRLYSIVQLSGSIPLTYSCLSIFTVPQAGGSSSHFGGFVPAILILRPHSRRLDSDSGEFPALESIVLVTRAEYQHYHPNLLFGEFPSSLDSRGFTPTLPGEGHVSSLKLCAFRDGWDCGLESFQGPVYHLCLWRSQSHYHTGVLNEGGFPTNFSTFLAPFKPGSPKTSDCPTIGLTRGWCWQKNPDTWLEAEPLSREVYSSSCRTISHVNLAGLLDEQHRKHSLSPQRSHIRNSPCWVK